MIYSVCLVSVCLVFISTAATAFQRPIWNIGHMVNAVKQVDSFLDDGANGLEVDVTFNKYGVAEYTYHGVPCDCFRHCLRWEYLTTFLDHVRELTTPGNPKFREGFVLLILDLKVSKYSQSVKEVAMRDLSQKLIHNLFSHGTGSRLHVVLSVPKLKDIDLVPVVHKYFEAAALGHLAQKIGWDVYSNEDLSTIKDKWSRNGVSNNIWQPDGITNCLPRSSTRLIKALQLRDSQSDSYMHKVYYWTVDRKSTMRYALDLGVDGIITNHPARLRDVLNEQRGRYRLATYKDSPYQTIRANHKYQKMIMPKILINVEDTDGPEKVELYKPFPGLDDN